jgi:AbrB family looped-hinge helix DNA binding protein
MVGTITIDKAGRVVIPAAVRRELALVAGSELALEVEHGTIRLRPLARASLGRRGRRLVVSSPLEGDVPDHRELRDEHLEGLAGPGQ